jgi:tetratricopeptide (TPR) repeat protein
VACLSAGAAHAGSAEDRARAAYEKGMAEFGLGNYAAAAEQYEAAYRIKPDGALLFNAAQAHRRAGHTQRALDLYRNFVRLYPGKEQLVADARKRIAELEKQLSTDSTPPPADKPAPGAAARTEPPPMAPAPLTAASSPSAQPSDATPAEKPRPALALATAPATKSETTPGLALQKQPASTEAASQRSIFASPWFWVAAGAVLAAGAVTAFVVLNPSYPDATFGQVKTMPGN